MKSVISFIGLNAVRVVIIGFAVLFAVLGFIIFIWFGEFREDLFKH
ncbi:hypothetical protein IOU64_004428 [Salmonella enterica]|nr:hypothetical protein [Salmonella enterica]